MNDDQAMQIFFEIHTGLPREGPGSTASTRRAFSMLGTLPDEPYILDIGCGPGMQTLDLLTLANGQIVALDNHQPFLDDLTRRAAQRGVAGRVATVNADMSNLGFFKESIFDVVWAEGSAYIMGFENALHSWKPFLKRPGYLAVSEIVWLKPDPPGELRDFFAGECPWMQGIEANAQTVRRAGYRLIGHFTLPESDWRDDYYTPIEQKLPVLREKYKGNSEALAVIEFHEREIDIFRKYSDYYGYEFYVMRT